MTEQRRVGVIGAGIGGMAAAISCAAQGWDVTIFEKNNRVGGKCNVLQKDGFSFDLGPSILTLPHIFEELFSMHKKRMADYVDIVALDLHWRNFFEDGTVFDLYADNEKNAALLDAEFPGAGIEYRSFVEYSKRQFEIADKKYFKEGMDTIGSFFRDWSFPEMLFRLDMFRTMNDSVSRFFGEQHLRDVFNYFIKYVGSSAYNAPGFMNLLPWVQLGFGLWYVKGGMYNMARGMARLMDEIGVTVNCNSEVEQIIHENGRVTGVKVKNSGIHIADAVISNMEVIPAYEKLLGESRGFLRKFDKFEPACSGIVLHLGLDKVYSQLAHHNFIYSKDQRHHFDLVFNKHVLPTDATIYLVAPTRTDPTQAPEGCDNLKILPHIPYINEKNPVTSQEYELLAERTIDKLEAVGLKDIRKHILIKDFWTPVDIQAHYYSNKGSIYGVVSDLKKNHAIKAPRKSARYSGLYFVGGSVNPGAGMPMVCLSGQNTAKQVIRDLK